MRRGLAGKEEGGNRNKGLESWNKDVVSNGRRAVVMRKQHLPPPLDEGPSKGAASQIVETQILLFLGMVVAEGIQVRGDPKQGQGPSTFHFLPPKLPPQELFEISGRSGHFI